MRVLHVTTCIGGGVPVAIGTLADSTSDLAHWLLAPQQTMRREALAGFIPMHTAFRRRRAQFKAVVAELQPSVVHAHSSWAGLMARTSGLSVPIVYQPHAFAFEMAQGVRGRVFKLVERFLAPRTAVTIALTAHEASLARELRSNGPVALVPNVAPEPSTYRANRQIASPPVVLAVGRIVPQKAPHRFAELASSLGDTEAAFVWVGDGDPALRAELEDAGVTVTGWTTSDEVRALMDRATVYVHVANYEGFPLTVLEAAASGLAIVALDIPSFKESGLVTSRTMSSLERDLRTMLSDEGRRRERQLISIALADASTSARQALALRAAYRTATGEIGEQA